MEVHDPYQKKDAAVITGSGESRELLQEADLDGELEALRGDLRQERERHVRTLADFKNYRRRVEREGNTLAESGKREMLLPLISIIDDLEKALQWADGEERPLKKGLHNITLKALALLEAQEVRPFASEGKMFTPDLHEAVAIAEDSDVARGIIVEDLRRGYLWKNELLRAAQVRVAG